MLPDYERLVFQINVRIRPNVISYDIENGPSGVVGLGASVGLFIFMYYVIWLFASKFADFAFYIRVMNQMYRANVKPDLSDDKSHISRMSDIKSSEKGDREGGSQQLEGGVVAGVVSPAKGV